MANDQFNSLDRDTVMRIIARQDDRIKRLESLLSGQPIGSARIADLSADKITTGTFIVRDGNDGAKIVVQDGDGNEIIVLDVDGIEVNGGNIIVKNEDGDTVFDAKGLVSDTSFYSDRVTQGGSTTTTSTTTVQLASMVLTTPNLTRSVRAAVFFTGQTSMFQASSSPYDSAIVCVVRLNGVEQSSAFIINRYNDSITHVWQTSTTHAILDLPPGVNQIDVGYKVVPNSGAAATAEVFARTLSYVILGT